MLAIEVVFLTGRYVATAYNTRTESEWPPHPARLFSALVATHFAADDAAIPNGSGERVILEWIERLGAPSIQASEATSRDVVTVFVPVNDAALTDVDDEAKRVDEARAALADAEAEGDAKAVKKHAASVERADAALNRAVARATDVPSAPLDPRYGQRVLPDYRVRQPRRFPSVTPDEPRVTYVWADAAPTEEQRRSLDELLRRVVRVGHSSSLVSVRLVDHVGPPTWRPAIHGEATLRVVQPGQVAALEQAFARHREVEPRVMPSLPQSYARDGLETAPPPRESVFSDEWLVLRRVGGPFFPMTSSAGVARILRKTLMSFADEPMPELLCGHTADNRPSQQPHLAIVPLPFVGHQHATGAILGVALVFPRAASGSDRRAVYSAVARWEQKYRQEDEDIPTVQLYGPAEDFRKGDLGAVGELRLERVEWGSVQASLRPQVWCAPARVWYSVTPVALDRNPGDLRSRDPRKQAEATDEAVEIICRACQRINLPRPKYVEILPAAPWAGAAKARHYPSYPADTARPQRVLTHVRLEFDHRVSGPLLLGAGRYLGLGLFRPEAS